MAQLRTENRGGFGKLWHCDQDLRGQLYPEAIRLKKAILEKHPRKKIPFLRYFHRTVRLPLSAEELAEILLNLSFINKLEDAEWAIPAVVNKRIYTRIFDNDGVLDIIEDNPPEIQSFSIVATISYGVSGYEVLEHSPGGIYS